MHHHTNDYSKAAISNDGFGFRVNVIIERKNQMCLTFQCAKCRSWHTGIRNKNTYTGINPVSQRCASSKGYKYK